MSDIRTLDTATWGQSSTLAERNRVLRNTYWLLALSLVPTVLGAWLGVATGITASLSGGVGLVWAAGDLVASDLTLDVQGTNQTISLTTTDGSFTFDNLSSFTNTGNDDFVIVTQGTAKNIEFAGMFTLAARNVSLTATGDIVSGTAAAEFQTS